MTAIPASFASRSFGLTPVRTPQTVLVNPSATHQDLPAQNLLTAFLPSRLQRDPDYLLVQMALAGSEQAYTNLVHRYRRMVFSLAFDITGNPEDADEAVQDAFLKAFRYLGAWRGESRFSTWLYHIARTTALDRRNRRRLNTVSIDDETKQIGARLKMVSDPTPGVEERLLTNERHAQLRSALEELIAPDRTVLILFYLKEQSLEEICQIMGWTLSNTKSRLCRARHRLRAVMGGYGGRFFAELVLHF